MGKIKPAAIDKGMLERKKVSMLLEVIKKYGKIAKLNWPNIKVLVVPINGTMTLPDNWLKKSCRTANMVNQIPKSVSLIPILSNNHGILVTVIPQVKANAKPFKHIAKNAFHALPLIT